MLEIKLPSCVGPTVQTSFFVTAFKSTMLIFTLFLITWNFSETNTCDEEFTVDKSYPINNCSRLRNDTNIQIAAKELFKLMDVNPLVCPNDQIKDYKMMIKKSLPTKSRTMKKGDSMKLDEKNQNDVVPIIWNVPDGMPSDTIYTFCSKDICCTPKKTLRSNFYNLCRECKHKLKLPYNYSPQTFDFITCQDVTGSSTCLQNEGSCVRNNAGYDVKITNRGTESTTRIFIPNSCSCELKFNSIFANRIL
ncbi:uncharacterized protein LOC136075500 isoform X2 [Hydra vulgaris]|uniref:Uncharacterized protein LOC136075500 isoform X2 n=1 Tax=Hydra vulgaris TaxID=6087 RepID=A0ABM4B7U5_HYDVU